MDGRKVLKAGAKLPFPGMECEIDSVVGCGSNAIVYRGYYHDQQNSRLVHHVLVKELFPMIRMERSIETSREIFALSQKLILA